MDALVALHTRTAAPRLVEPAPSGEALDAILAAGLRAPDHGMLRPWHFLLVSGDARQKLGDLCADAMQPEAEEQRKRLADAPLRAPLVIIGVAKVKEVKGIPAVEQMNSVAAALQNMSVAAHALGFGSIWRTGPVAHDPRVKSALGLDASDEIVGFLYMGTPTITERPLPEIDAAAHIQVWGN